MPMISTDWSIERATGNIRYIGDDHGGALPSYATDIEFHRWVNDFADDAVSVGDDEHDITDTLASDRSTDNIINLLGIYNIDDVAAEHLYDGSIIQGGGADIYDGFINFGNADVQIQIIQNGAVLSDDWWNFAGGGLNADANQGISHRFMLKTRSGGVDIDGTRLIGTSRTFGKKYKESLINGAQRGNNVLTLDDSIDLNNLTLEATVAGYVGITLVSAGYTAIDIDNNSVDEFYYGEWDANVPTNIMNDLYERGKWLTRDGSAETLYGLSGELFRGITHEIDVDTPTGTFDPVEAVSWASGTGQMLAINSVTAGTKMWIQLLTGTAPVDGDTITGGNSGATVDMNITVITRTISAPFIGATNGTSVVGGYGLGIQVDDVTSADKLFDLTNTLIIPPNNVIFTMLGLVPGEDRVLVTNDAAGIDFTQMTLLGALTGAAETAVQMTAPIPTDSPVSGTLRIITDSGDKTLHAYSSFSGDTFTIAAADFSVDNASASNNAFISYIDKLAAATEESFTVVFNANRTLFSRVRDGGGTPIKQFESTGVLGSSGGSITAIRISDE